MLIFSSVLKRYIVYPTHDEAKLEYLISINSFQFSILE